MKVFNIEKKKRTEFRQIYIKQKNFFYSHLFDTIIILKIKTQIKKILYIKNILK